MIIYKICTMFLLIFCLSMLKCTYDFVGKPTKSARDQKIIAVGTQVLQYLKLNCDPLTGFEVKFSSQIWGFIQAGLQIWLCGLCFVPIITFWGFPKWTMMLTLVTPYSLLLYPLTPCKHIIPLQPHNKAPNIRPTVHSSPLAYTLLKKTAQARFLNSW